jgi:hypothetical protein
MLKLSLSALGFTLFYTAMLWLPMVVELERIKP